MNVNRSLSALSHCAWVCWLIGLAIGVLGATALAAGADVNYNAANDYYQAVAGGSGRQIAVESLHLGPGEEHLRKREYPQAAADFIFVLNIFPNHPRALPLMIEVCEQWKSLQCKPDEYLDKAIAINPNIAATYVIQGVYLYRKNKYPQSIQSFEQALAIDPNSKTTHYNLGLAYLETKQYDLANEHAQRAYALGASLPGLRNKLERVGKWKPLEDKAVPEPTPGTSTSKGDDRPDAAVKK
jgi:tetratricopeptide (TPR) repeat protein